MNAHYTDFFKDFYKISNGYVPFWPFKSQAELGDLFILRQGHMIRLGNITDKFFGIYEDISIEEKWHSTNDEWSMQRGVHHSFRLPQATKFFCDPCDIPGLKLNFESIGDYFFHTPEVWHRSIENFYEFKFKLLQQLTSEKCSFKEVFVVSSIAKVDYYSLVIAAANEAQIIISADKSENIPQHLKYIKKEDYKGKVIDLQGIHVAHLFEDGGQLFFKAQKLSASHQGREIVRKYIAENLPQSMQAQTSGILRYTPTQILPSVDIYPAKVHELFDFRQMTLNDIDFFFGEYTGGI